MSVQRCAAMLNGKTYTYNVHTLRMDAEELIQPIVQPESKIHLI